MFKVDLCPIEEYESEIDNRIHEAVLTVGGIYTVMFNFKESIPLSLRYTAQVEDMSGDTVDSHLLRYIGLDPDLKPFDPIITVNISDGILNFKDLKRPCFKLLDDNDQPYRAPLGTGYFKDYAEPYGLDQNIREVIDLSNLAPA